jgi:hypothetical protein
MHRFGKAYRLGLGAVHKHTHTRDTHHTHRPPSPHPHTTHTLTSRPFADTDRAALPLTTTMYVPFLDQDIKQHPDSRSSREASPALSKPVSGDVTAVASPESSKSFKDDEAQSKMAAHALMAMYNAQMKAIKQKADAAAIPVSKSKSKSGKQ